MAMSVAWKTWVSSCLSDLLFLIWWTHSRHLTVASCNTFLSSLYFDGKVFSSKVVKWVPCSSRAASFPCFYWLWVQVIVLVRLSSYSSSAHLHHSSSWSGFIRYVAKLFTMVCPSPDLQNTAFYHFVICFPFPLVGALWLGRSVWHLLPLLSSTVTWHCDCLPPSGSRMWLRLPIVLICASVWLA